MTGYEIRAATNEDLPRIRQLVRDYVEWIALDLAFQEIDAEIDGLPGEYAPPGGVLLVACSLGRAGNPKKGLPPPNDNEGLPPPGEPVAMIALRPLDETTCEMKRLYVSPPARGHGLARALIARLLDEARALGYQEICLDTLPMMGDAQALYAALGFVDIPPYYDTPIAGTRFMAKPL